MMGTRFYAIGSEHFVCNLRGCARIICLPRSNGLMFPIHTYMISLEELLTNLVWTKRLYLVLKNLPPDLVEYKGWSSYYDTVLTWLSQFDKEPEPLFFL